MQLFLFYALWLILQVSGQSLMQILKTKSELTTLLRYVNSSSSMTSLLSSLDNFSLLAPSNAAFRTFDASRNGSPLNANELEEFLRYHILVGNHTINSWSSRPQFVPTYLTGTKNANVSGGEVVELALNGQRNAQIISFNKSISTIVTPVCTSAPNAHICS